jgi:DNA recombination protein RmuC
MTQILLLANVVLLFVLLIVVLKRTNPASSQQLLGRFDAFEKDLSKTDAAVREEIGRNRQESASIALGQRQELANSIDKMRETVEHRLKDLQAANTEKLDQMRTMVDKNLHETLDTRLGKSFEIVNQQLGEVHKGLGEMRDLAKGVGDLKNLLTNVKVRGTWGEIQLANLLGQLLTLDQYEANVVTKEGSREQVEFAIKLPGREGKEGQVVWLPIDAKFPREDYDRLLEAQEKADAEAAADAAKQLEIRIRSSAKDIRDKYLNPPQTTDFGIMFLPIEGLYAEVLRRPGLVEGLQRDYRVVVTGPTTLGALLNALQMGFRTLAIEKRSSEVWKLLGAIKTEFGKFTDIIVRAHRQLSTASTTLDSAAQKTRTIQRKLRDVEVLPSQEAAELLPPSDVIEPEEMEPEDSPTEEE